MPAASGLSSTGYAPRALAVMAGFAEREVYTRMVEDVLLSHPRIREAAVVGMPDEAIGEVVHAFVVSAPGTAPTADEVRAHALTQLGPVWAPRVVHFVAALPLTGSGKVDKTRLRAGYAGAGATVGPAG